ncbi:MAG TPA: MFS transporter, partial [Solirubrobacteraceae bacterium]|nr:MFS transporter [Solirubrobacteraceae bacterium]
GDRVGPGPVVAGFAVAALALVTFLLVEHRTPEPMLPLGLFRNRPFSGSLTAQFAISAGLFASYLYATLYLQRVLGLSAIEAGLVYLPATFVNFATAACTGVLAQRGVSNRAMIGGGLLLVAVGMALVTLGTVDSSWVMIEPGMIVAMAGTGLLNPTAVAVALESVPQEQSGLAAGTMDTFRQAGIAIGVAGLGALIPASTGLGSADPAAFVDGLHTAMWVGAAVSLGGALAAFRLLRSARRPAVAVATRASEAPA